MGRPLADCAGPNLVDVERMCFFTGVDLRSWWGRRFLSAPTALVLDALVGGTFFGSLPQVVYERAIGFAEEILWTDTFFGGLRFLLVGAAPATLAGKLAELAIGGFAADAAAGSVCVGLRSLRESALAIVAHLERGELEAAAALAGVSAAVGGVPPTFDGVARSAIESITTKFAGEVVGPLVFLNFGGAAGALTYRAVGAMSEKVRRRPGAHARFGVVPKRMAEALGRVPGQLAALALCNAAHGGTAAMYSRVRRESLSEPFPGEGVVMAAMACALGVGLGSGSSPTAGSSGRPTFGPPRIAGLDDVRKAVALAERASVLVALWLMLVDLGLRFVAARTRRGAREGRLLTPH